MTGVPKRRSQGSRFVLDDPAGILFEEATPPGVLSTPLNEVEANGKDTRAPSRFRQAPGRGLE
jgi:hypothetical protein